MPANILHTCAIKQVPWRVLGVVLAFAGCAQALGLDGYSAAASNGAGGGVGGDASATSGLGGSIQCVTADDCHVDGDLACMQPQCNQTKCEYELQPALCPDGFCDSDGVCHECGVDTPAPSDSCPDECDTCDNGVCRIHCGATNCVLTTVSCPNDGPCLVDCSGYQECQNTLVKCPDGYPCDVDCNCQGSTDDCCLNITVECGDDTCQLRCHGDACLQGTLLCGPDRCESICTSLTVDYRPTVVCGESCDCQVCPFP